MTALASKLIDEELDFAERIAEQREIAEIAERVWRSNAEAIARIRERIQRDINERA